LPDETLLVNSAWLDTEMLRGFARVEVPETEPWAANVALVGGNVCAATVHERTVEMIRTRGFVVHTADLSEFAKAEGGVTCLSLLFSAKES
jgi:dimethylargininase